MFAEGSPPLSWDREHAYTREAIELYYEAGSGSPLSKTEYLRHLLEGTAGALAESIIEEEKDASTSITDGIIIFRRLSVEWSRVISSFTYILSSICNS
ncbi:hypothetical protein MKW94_013221, partial [Papaver nudicaule]|nr:hypothetical protein [Papaver nudicaule]